MPGFHYIVQGIEVIMAPGMRRYVILPLLINTVLLTAFVAGGAVLFNTWMEHLLDSLPAWLEFLYWIMWLLFALTMSAILFFCFTIVANIVAAPFNALLSVRVEDRARGSTSWREANEPWAAMVTRTISREFAKFAWYFPRLLGLALLSLVPGLNVLAPPLWLLFGAWMMAVEYADYGADNNGLGFAELRDRLSGQRLTSLGFGGVVYAMLLIPVVNLIVMPAAVAGGTLFWVERLSHKVN